MATARLKIVLGCLVLCALACAVPLPTVTPLTIIDLVDVTESVPRADAQRAEVRLRLLSDSLTVRSSAEVDLLRGRFRYNVEEWAPNIKQETKDNGERVIVTVGQGLGSQIPLGGSAEYVNAWEIDLARGIPLDLSVDIGAGETQLDLSGLMLSQLSVTSGSAEQSLVFHEANPIPMSTLRLTAGTGKCVAAGLGNANFDRLVVFGGVGALDLDFGGAWTRGALAEVRAGAGKITLRVPATIGVRVVFSSSPLSVVETTGFTVQTDNVYTNAAYGVAPVTLTINITAGVGAMTLISQ